MRINSSLLSIYREKRAVKKKWAVGCFILCRFSHPYHRLSTRLLLLVPCTITTNSSSAEKAVHLMMRMEDALKKMIYDSEYNIYWMAAEQWEKMGNAAALHILRMESLPRSRLEAADLLDTVKFPVTKGDHGGTIMEKYRAS